MYTEGGETARQVQQEKRENILCEQKDKICADSFLAAGPEHWNSSVWMSGRGRTLHSRADFSETQAEENITQLYSQLIM